MPPPSTNRNRRVDDYSDDFETNALDANRWLDAGTPDFVVSGGSLRATIGAGTDYSRLTNLVRLRRTTDTAIAFDLEIQFSVSYNLDTPFGAAGQGSQVGWACTFLDGTTRRRLIVQDAQGQPNPLARVQDQTGSFLGSSLTLNVDEQGYFLLSRSGTGGWTYKARKDPGDAWTVLHTETITQEIILSELFAEQRGAATPAWVLQIEIPDIRRTKGMMSIGSVLDKSYAHGTVADDAFLDILDQVKPSGLLIVVQE